MRRRVFHIITTIIFLLAALAGCAKPTSDHQNTYSFDDSTIAAYVMGEPIDKEEMEQYICMKSEYMSELVSLGAEPKFDSNSDDPTSKARDIMNTVSYKIKYRQAERYLSYNTEEKRKDYFKTVIVRNNLKKEKEYDKSIKDFIKHMVDHSVQDKLDNDDVPLTIDDDSEIYVSVIIKKVADKCDLSYKDCVETIYRPYAKCAIEEESYSMYYFGSIKGEKVEYNGSNEKEYEEYMFNLFEGYYSYMDNLLEKAEIVIRP